MNFDNKLEISLEIERLGKVEILRVVGIDGEWISIDRKYSNRLLKRESQ
jgi:hypothetical protein